MDPNHVPFEELPITNRFMFALVFSHKHIAKPFLEAILGIKIFDLQEPEPEKSTETSPFNKGESYRNLKEQYIIFICPDDIFKQDRAVYRFKNLEKGHPEHELGDLCYKNFYIFNKYRDVAEQSVKEYLEYFATNKATSKGTKNIELQRQWYLSDNETRKRYMTWQQELDDLVYDERQRTKAAEKRASEAETRADAAESRAEKYEKILKEHGLL